MKTRNSSATHSKISYFYKSIFSKPNIFKQRNLPYTALNTDDDDDVDDEEETEHYNYIKNNQYHSRMKNNVLDGRNARLKNNVDLSALVGGKSRDLQKVGSWAKAVRIVGRIGPRRLRKFNRSCCIVLFVLIIISLIILISIRQPFSIQWHSSVDDEIFSLVSLHPQKCNFPTLNPFDEEMMRLIKKIQKNNESLVNTSCSWEVNQQPTSFLADHQYLNQTRKLKLKKDHLGKDPPFCCYTPFYRVSDNEISQRASCINLTSNVTRMKEEFVQLHCQLPIFHTDYRDAFALIPEKPEVESRVGKIQVDLENQLSVILFGLDSVSHMHFIRQLHQSRDYLVNELKAIPLNGYTKVAENTLPNVIPMLSGMSLTEFTKLCIPSSSPPSDVHLDECPFIWKEFSARGYRTSYAEDQNHIGIFNMDWPYAFNKQPTDYDLRTLTRYTESIFGEQQCQGSRTSFKLLLDNVLNMAKAFKDRLYFQFTWSTRLSHDNVGNVHIGDQDMLTTLRSLHKNGLLNKSVLIVMSDHGGRLGDLRATVQGKLEDRMPLAYITVPPWFNTKYPMAMKNLRDNSNRLTTPFDIHQTLHSFWNLSSLESDGRLVTSNKNPLTSEQTNKYHPSNVAKYQNLFSQISENRTCFEAGIPLHWCLCNRKLPYHTKDELVRDAMTFILNDLNQFVKSRTRGECADLQLKEIISAERWKDEKVKDLLISKKEKTEDTVIILQISFLTEPGTGAFEGTVVKSPSLRQGWTLTERIVRTNRYEDESHCVEDREIKEYCYCTGFDYYM